MPMKNKGDSSIDSECFKSIEEETEKKKNLLKNKNVLLIPRNVKKTNTKNSKKKKDIVSQRILKLTPHSSTKDTDFNKKSFGNSFKSLNKGKECFLKVINKKNNNKENNRYNNCLDKIPKRNLKFLSCLKDEESDYDENIIENEISVNFIEGFNIKSKKINDEQIEVLYNHLEVFKCNIC